MLPSVSWCSPSHPGGQRQGRPGREIARSVAVALANKMARVAWALLAYGGTYRAPKLAEAA